MASLTYRFATMGSGKSAEIISVFENYQENITDGLILIPQIDTASKGFVSSRNGKSIKATSFDKETDLFKLTSDLLENEVDINYVIVDEANFLTVEQAEQLGDIVDFLDISVMAYGLLTDFQTDSFPGSKRLYEISDIKEELTARRLCPCGKKALFNARIVNGELVKEGEKIVIKGEEQDIKYIPLCRKCFKLGKWKKTDHKKIKHLNTKLTNLEEDNNNENRKLKVVEKNKNRLIY